MIELLAAMAAQGCIFAVALLGLNVIWGWAGDLDLAFYGYLAAGAYMAVVTSIGRLPPPDQYIFGWRVPFPAAAAVAMAAAGLLALLVGAAGLRRLRTVHFAVMTLGTVVMLHIFVSDYRPLFNGFNGLYGMPRPFAGAAAPQTDALAFLGLCAGVLAGVYLLMERLSNSAFGRSLRAVREDERAAAAFGRNVYALKLQAYVLGAATAGLAGALLAAFLGAFSPAAWSPDETLDLYAALVIGGRGNPRGAVLGAFLVLVVFDEGVRLLPALPGHPTFWLPVREIVMGLMIVAALRFRLQGLLPERRPADTAPAPQTRALAIGEHAVRG
jgi:branched-chain amino acid transport system permease protein